MARKYTIAVAVVIAGIVGYMYYSSRSRPVADYDPPINPAEFTTNITNPYMSLPVGKVLEYEAQTEIGVERIRIEITGETKTILGVETLAYWDREWLNDELVEDVKDYLAQDQEGNVWYFGEDVDQYEDGELVGHEGAWQAGEDDAKPGIWFKANPQAGDSYRQVYYAGETEDMADVLSVNETVTTSYGTFRRCVKTLDWTPLEKEAQEHKYYCPDVGAVALVESLEDGEIVQLVGVE